MDYYKRTTLNLHVTTMKVLNDLHGITGLSRREIVILAMNKLVLDRRMCSQETERQLKYQDADPGKDNWHTFHIAFTIIEYDYFCDIRYFFRMTSSLLISIALHIYFHLFLSKEIYTCDFLFHAYAVESFVHNDVQTWVRYWGMPSELCGWRDNYLNSS